MAKHHLLWHCHNEFFCSDIEPLTLTSVMNFSTVMKNLSPWHGNVLGLLGCEVEYKKGFLTSIGVLWHCNKQEEHMFKQINIRHTYMTAWQWFPLHNQPLQIFGLLHSATEWLQKFLLSYKYNPVTLSKGQGNQTVELSCVSHQTKFETNWVTGVQGQANVTGKFH